MMEIAIVAAASVLAAGFAMGVGAIGPGIGEGIALARALSALAQQPDEANTITRTLFVGLAMIESTGIYALVIALILLFANPFWGWAIQNMGG